MSEQAKAKSNILMIHHVFIAFLLFLDFSFVEPGSELSKDATIVRERLRALALANDSIKMNIRSEFVPRIYEVWDPNNPSSNSTNPYLGQVFNVALHHRPPMVIIDDWESVLVNDPGNVNQTRTFGHGLDGITVTFLQDLAAEFNCTFNYYYPCPTAKQSGTCLFADVQSPQKALALLTDDFCTVNSQLGFCFAAGAIKLTSSIAQNYDFTHPFHETDFQLITMSGDPPFQFMSWASPFDYTIWIALVVEIMIIGALFMFTEGYGTNDEHVTGVFGLGQQPLNSAAIYFESVYWSLLILVTGNDKTPTTHGGRTITMAQLFFYLIIVSIYTGTLINFLLAEPVSTPIDSFADLYDRKAPNFKRGNSLCIATNQPSMQDWVRTASVMYSTEFNVITATDILDCLNMVYLRKATATFYDEPVIKYHLLQDFLQIGKCGQGGFCSDPTINYQDCSCPVLVNKVCSNPNHVVTTDISGTLTMVGSGFNPFGYSLFFRNDVGRSDIITFNMAIYKLRESVQMIDIENLLPNPDPINDCANNDNGAALVLQVKHIFGIMVMTGAFFFLGLVFGLIEHFIHLVIRICPCCCAAKGETNVFDDLACDLMPPDPDEGKGPAPPSLDSLDGDLTVSESLLELQTRFDRIEELLQTAIVKSKS